MKAKMKGRQGQKEDGGEAKTKAAICLDDSSGNVFPLIFFPEFFLYFQRFHL